MTTLAQNLCPVHKQQLIGLCNECQKGQKLAVCQECINNKSSAHYCHTSLSTDQVSNILNIQLTDNTEKLKQYEAINQDFEKYFTNLKHDFEKLIHQIRHDVKKNAQNFFGLVRIISEFKNKNLASIYLDPDLSFILREVIKQKKLVEIDPTTLNKHNAMKPLIEQELKNAFGRIQYICQTGNVQPQETQVCKTCDKLKGEILKQQNEIIHLKEQIKQDKNASATTDQMKKQIIDLQQQCLNYNNTIANLQNQAASLQVSIQQFDMSNRQLQIQMQNMNQFQQVLNEQNQMVKETNLQKSLQTLDKNNKQYNELVKLWKDKYDKLIQNKKGGFCGKKTFSNILVTIQNNLEPS